MSSKNVPGNHSQTRTNHVVAMSHICKNKHMYLSMDIPHLDFQNVYSPDGRNFCMAFIGIRATVAKLYCFCVFKELLSTLLSPTRPISLSSIFFLSGSFTHKPRNNVHICLRALSWVFFACRKWETVVVDFNRQPDFIKKHWWVTSMGVSVKLILQWFDENRPTLNTCSTIPWAQVQTEWKLEKGESHAQKCTQFSAITFEQMASLAMMDRTFNAWTRTNPFFFLSCLLPGVLS